MWLNIAIYLTIGLALNELAQWRLSSNGYAKGNWVFSSLFVFAWPLTVLFVLVMTLYYGFTRKAGDDDEV